MNPLRWRKMTWLVCLIIAVAGTVAGFWLGRHTKVTDAAPIAATIASSPTLQPPIGMPVAVPATAAPSLRDSEYAKVKSLRAGMYVGRFEQALGVPVFVRRSKDGTRLEKTFAEPEYFVQTVEDSDGTVHLMAITSCTPEFQPTFVTPVGSVTLSSTTMKDFGNPTDHVYFVGGTSNTYFYDEYYTGNASGYKMYIVGVDDACNYHVPLDAVRKYGGQNIPGQVTDPDPLALRQGAIVNTYAETAPMDFQLDMALGKDPTFQIGVNRIWVRTLPASPP
jgi:hypothetical protein